jgi:predicted amidohydrolase YtcJ
MLEAHAHLYMLGESLTLPSLATCRSLEDALERIRSASAAARERAGPGAPAWVRIRQAHVHAWPEGRWPTLAELDRACGDVACVLLSFDHHEGVASTTALTAAGLTPGMRVPPKGVVVADAQGRATGQLLETAVWRAWETAPAPSDPERRAMVGAALRHLHALGFTEVHDLLSQPWLGAMLGAMHDAGQLGGMRVLLHPPLAELDRVVNGDATTPPRNTWERSDLRLAGTKIFADGTLSGGTALVLHAYEHPIDDTVPYGRAMVTPAEIDRAIGKAAAAGVVLAVHAIGDAAVRMTLDAWERSDSSVRRGRLGWLRIEHCELIDERDVPRFAELGVTCSVQPCHMLYDIEVLTRHLPHRLHRVLPLRELIDAGCGPGEQLWFGSDVPIVRADPQDSILAATERRRTPTWGVCGGESAAIAPEQAISEAEAWYCFGRIGGAS